MIFSEEAALKYFGDENPIGEKVTITFNDKYKESFFVKGVTEKLPENAGFGFNILIPYNKQLDLGIKDFNDWSKLTRATFIQLHSPEEISTIKAQSIVISNCKMRPMLTIR